MRSDADGRRADRARTATSCSPRNPVPASARSASTSPTATSAVMPAPTAAGGWTRSSRSPTASAASSCTTRWSPTSGRWSRSRRASPSSSPRCCGAFWRPTKRASHGRSGCPRSRSSRPFPPTTRLATTSTRCTGSSDSSSSPPASASADCWCARHIPLQPHRFDVDRYEPTARLTAEPVLLIDDTWTTGANAQSAAAALKRAGAGPVAAVVIGRHLNRRWGSNDSQLNGLPTTLRLGPLRAM